MERPHFGVQEHAAVAEQVARVHGGQGDWSMIQGNVPGDSGVLSMGQLETPVLDFLRGPRIDAHEQHEQGEDPHGAGSDHAKSHGVDVGSVLQRGGSGGGWALG